MFSLDINLCTIQLIQINGLDFETLPTIVLTVEVEDRGIGTPLTSTTAITITVEDVNDNAPVCWAFFS